MNHRVQAYSLPEGAGRLDRATLFLWKSWDAWLRPVFGAAILMIAGQLLVAALSGAGGSGGDVRQWRLLVKWGGSPPPVVSTTASPLALHAWSIAAQAMAAFAGALTAWFVLRRHQRPASLGAMAGLVATVAHLSVAHLFTLEPLGYRGYPGLVIIGGHGTQHQALGTIWSNAFAVAALWSPILFGAAFGWWLERRRLRASADVAAPERGVLPNAPT